MFRILAAVSAAALMAGAAQAQDAAVPAADPVAPAAAVSASGVTDAQLASFAGAMTKMRSVAEAVGTGTPTPAQQTEMAAAVEASGLGIEQFNSISAAVSADASLQARLAVLATPESATGSVAAGVTDAEVGQFSAAMVQMRAVAPAAGATPTAEQQAAMASTVEASGLAIDRFNAIATAVSQDARLRARVQLADTQRAGG